MSLLLTAAPLQSVPCTCTEPGVCKLSNTVPGGCHCHISIPPLALTDTAFVVMAMSGSDINVQQQAEFTRMVQEYADLHNLPWQEAREQRAKESMKRFHSTQRFLRDKFGHDDVTNDPK